VFGKAGTRFGFDFGDDVKNSSRSNPKKKKPLTEECFFWKFLEILKAMYTKPAPWIIRAKERTWRRVKEDVQINKPGFWSGRKTSTSSRTCSTPPPKHFLIP